MDGITEFDIKFKRSLIEQLNKINKTLEKIAKEMETQNNLRDLANRHSD